MTGTALVTGGSGYIAGYIMRQLIGEGWTVHTTIRDLAHEQSVRDVLAVDNARLKFFAANLLSDAGWAEANARCSHVVHVASPLARKNPKNDDELIIPARDGALRALRAAKAAGVKRFVMTSSIVAIAYGHGNKEQTFTEADWTNIDSPDAYSYVKSKTIAERAARDWIAAEGDGMEYVSVNPSLVLGPIMSGDFSLSLESVKKLLEGSLLGCPDIAAGIVDVRDVADLHVRVLTAPNMAGERFIASGPSLKMIEIARILKSGLGAEGRKVPMRRLPDFLVRLSALFDPLIKQVTGELGKVRRMDASHANEVLGWLPRPAADSIIDTARALIDHGVVKL